MREERGREDQEDSPNSVQHNSPADSLGQCLDDFDEGILSGDVKRREESVLVLQKALGFLHQGKEEIRVV